MMEKEIAVEKNIKRYDAYKNSGVEWLGDIPEHWEVFPLFALTSLKSITNCVDEELLSVYLERGVIRFSDVDSKRTNVTSLDLSKYQLVEPGDFVLNNQQAWRGSVGVSKYTGIVSPAYIVLKLSNKINPIYANYLFRDGSMVSQYLINSKGVGTIQRNLYWPSLRRSSISLPPLAEQTAIAQFLDDKTTKIDQAIAIKQQQIALLKERKQILIHKLVTGQLVKTGDAWTEPVEVKDSGVEWIGEIPEHWEIIQLKHLIIAIGDIDHYMPESVEKGYPYVMTGDLKELASEIEFSNCKQVSEKDYKKLSNKIKSTKGDIILARYATIGTLTYVDINSDFLVSYSCVTIKPNQLKLSGLFLCNYLKSDVFEMEAKFQTNTNTQGNVGIGDLKNIKLAIPPLSEQKEIANYIEAASANIETAISLKEKEINKLQEYKSSLINSVVTGKVRVC